MIPRTIISELMDRDDVGVGDLRQSLGFIRRVNGRLGGYDAVLRHLRQWSRGWPRGRTIRILDIATGSADIPLAIARWSIGAGHEVQITAIDRHATTLSLAAEHLATDSEAAQRVTLLQADALKLPFGPGSFDYAITSMFLHHLADIQVMTILKAMDTLASRGLIWNDLKRSRWAYFWCRLMTLRSHPIVQHDGPVSVLAGFSRVEVLDFRRRLELDYLQYRGHWASRFTLAGERTSSK